MRTIKKEKWGTCAIAIGYIVIAGCLALNGGIRGCDGTTIRSTETKTRRVQTTSTISTTSTTSHTTEKDTKRTGIPGDWPALGLLFILLGVPLLRPELLSEGSKVSAMRAALFFLLAIAGTLFVRRAWEAETVEGMGLEWLAGLISVALAGKAAQKFGEKPPPTPPPDIPSGAPKGPPSEQSQSLLNEERAQAQAKADGESTD